MIQRFAFCRIFAALPGLAQNPYGRITGRVLDSTNAVVRADGVNNFDLSAFKNFRFREKWNLQLRSEGMNALNHAHFAAPVSNPTNSLFGQVSNTTFSRQRVISMGARLQW